jgi:hypothetical protein
MKSGKQEGGGERGRCSCGVAPSGCAQYFLSELGLAQGTKPPSARGRSAEAVSAPAQLHQTGGQERCETVLRLRIHASYFPSPT